MVCACGLTGDCMKDSLDAHAVTIHDGTKWVVRRITPRESERLQGFPDDWTSLVGCDVDAVTEKVAASLHYSDEEKESLRRKVRRWSRNNYDAPRYKACGNSFPVTVVRWIGERIQEVDALDS